MKPDKLLTIGIPALNAKSDLDRLLTSIQNELTGVDYEVIVADNGSHDGTPELMREKYPWVCYLYEVENVGIAKSTNLIFEKMRGKYWLRLDVDTVLKTSAVEKMIEYMDSNPRVGVLAPRLENLDGSFQSSYETHFKLPIEWLWDYALWLKKIVNRLSLKSIVKTEPFEIAYAASAAVMVRKEAIDQIGELDPAMDFFMEDADFIYRIKQHGWQIVYDPRISIIHIGGQSGTLYIHTRDRSLKNLYYFYQKFRPGLINQVILGGSILVGSALSLGLSLTSYPVIFIKPGLKSIYHRSVKSFFNVFIWHLKQLRSII